MFDDLKPGRPGTRHLTYLLGGGDDADGTYYRLLRDGKIICVQVEPISSSYDPENETLDQKLDWFNYHSKLTSIQILLDDLDFDRGDWVYIMHDEDGSDRLVYRRKPLVITKFLWAPLIDEKTIDYTKWSVLGHHREGHFQFHGWT